MSKIITAIVLAVVCHAIAAFIIGMNPSVPFSPAFAALVGAVAGLLIG